MPTVRPFRALRYDDTRVALERVLVPPPERTDDATRAIHYDADPRNIIRVLANRPEDGDEEKSALTRARTFLAQWRRARVVIQDEDPALYILKQRFVLHGEEVVRTGVYGALELDANAMKQILPHEETLAGRHTEVTKVADATGVQLEPISLLVDDDKSRLLRALSAELEEEPDVRFTIDSVDPAAEAYARPTEAVHELWVVDDETTCARVEQVLASTTMVIADGHHRFAAAKARSEESEKPVRLAVFLTPADDAGVRILPTHRVVHGGNPIETDTLLQELSNGFDVEPVDDVEALDAEIQSSSGQMLFGLLTTSGAFRLRPLADHIKATLTTNAPDPEIAYPDTSVLDATVVRAARTLGGEEDARTRYVREMNFVEETVRRGEGTAIGLLVRAPTVPEVLATARAGHVLPPKSTAFRPRLTTGLVMLQTHVTDDEMD